MSEQDPGREPEPEETPLVQPMPPAEDEPGKQPPSEPGEREDAPEEVPAS